MDKLHYFAGYMIQSTSFVEGTYYIGSNGKKLPFPEQGSVYLARSLPNCLKRLASERSSKRLGRKFTLVEIWFSVRKADCKRPFVAVPVDESIKPPSGQVIIGKRYGYSVVKGRSTEKPGSYDCLCYCGKAFLRSSRIILRNPKGQMCMTCTRILRQKNRHEKRLYFLSKPS